ncbi:hypothetical protein ACRYJU_20790 [Alloalcanivorax xenomutans]|uniref:hypothetical protein n=1 Tax=Alloalcanivorax xenomutans TaxID=1094342 RepID=UPI003D9B1A12
MKDFHTLAYHYYQTFYSYREHIGLVSAYTLLVAVSFVFFIGGMVCFLFYQEELASVVTERSMKLIALGSEILFIVTWAGVNLIKDRRVKSKVGLVLKRDFKYLSDAKRAWLESIIDVPRQDYLKLAKELSDSLALKEKHRTYPAPSMQSFFRSIYDPDSKPRVVSLLIFLFSVTALILIRSYNSESPPTSILFEVYNQSDDIFFLIIIAAILLWLFMIALVFSKDFILASLSSMNIWIDGKQSQSKTNASRLIVTLVENAAIPKKRMRVENDNGDSA